MKKNISPLYLILVLSLVSLVTQAQHFKNINASLFTDSVLRPGEIQTLRFILRLNNTDAEYGDSLAVEFPAGITPISSPTNPLMLTTENQPAEAYNGVFGQVVSWGDNNNLDTIGGIETGFNIFFEIKVMVDDTVTVAKNLRYFVSGDQMRFANPRNPKDQEDSISLLVKTAKPNLSLRSLFKPLFYRYPQNQMDSVRLAVEVKNIGGDLNDFGYVAFSAVSAGFSLEQGLPLPFLANADTIIEASILLKTQIGTEYDFLFGAVANPDNDFSNNFDSARFAVTDTILSRERGTPQGTITLAEPGEIGTWLQVEKRDTLSSVSFNITGLSIGDSIKFKVYNYAFAPLVELVASPTLIIDSVSANGWYTVTLDSGLVLNSGSFFIALKQHTATYLGLSYNDYKYSSGDNYYRLDSDPIWLPAESSTNITLVNTLFIRANFGDKVQQTVGVASYENKPLVSLFPNPVKEILHLSVKNDFYTIVDLSGKQLKSEYTTTGNIDVSYLSSGLYFIRINNQYLKFIKEL